jgi:hypothetical protein
MQPVVVVVLLGVFGSACSGGASPSGPSPALPAPPQPLSSPVLAGTWIGPLTDSLGGPGVATLDISQSGSSLVGPWWNSFPNDGLYHQCRRMVFDAAAANGTLLTSATLTAFQRCGPFPALPPEQPGSATFTGSQSGFSVSGTLAPPRNAPSCSFSVILTVGTATLGTASQMAGTYSAINCSVVNTGSFSLTKQ